MVGLNKWSGKACASDLWCVECVCVSACVRMCVCMCMCEVTTRLWCKRPGFDSSQLVFYSCDIYL